MSILCLFGKHSWRHIANFNDIQGGRGLYQCAVCRKVIMDISSNLVGRDRQKTVGSDTEYDLYN